MSVILQIRHFIKYSCNSIRALTPKKEDQQYFEQLAKNFVKNKKVSQEMLDNLDNKKIEISPGFLRIEIESLYRKLEYYKNEYQNL